MPDDQVRSAIANWGPRFTSQGVDPGDFIRVTSGLENWADWLDAWCANGDVRAGLAREAEGLGRRRTAGGAWVRAALSHHFAKFVWMLDETRHRAAADRAVAAMANAHRLLDPAAERLEVEFDGITMYGNLRRPPGAISAAHPVRRRGGPGAVHAAYRGRGLRGGPPPVHLEIENTSDLSIDRTVVAGVR